MDLLKPKAVLYIMNHWKFIGIGSHEPIKLFQTTNHCGNSEYNKEGCFINIAIPLAVNLEEKTRRKN